MEDGETEAMRELEADINRQLDGDTWQPPEDAVPVIVCAAYRHPHLKFVIAGARHSDKIMQPWVKMIRRFYGAGWQWEQGFIDQFGKFYNRVDAMQAVLKSGQPFDAERNSGSGDELYSEGLY